MLTQSARRIVRVLSHAREAIAKVVIVAYFFQVIMFSAHTKTFLCEAFCLHL